MSTSPQLPKIIAYFDLDQNCLYSAFEDKDKTLIKHMVVSKDPEFYAQPMSRLEMTYTGYSFQPVTIKDQHYQSFEKRRVPQPSKPSHWAINWFRADYQRWLALSHHCKKDVARVLGHETKTKSKEKIYTQPTTSVISKVGIIELVSAHVANAFCCDQIDDGDSYSVEEMLRMYLHQFNLVERHGVAFKNKSAIMLEQFNLRGAIRHNKERGTCTGVDSFIIGR